MNIYVWNNIYPVSWGQADLIVAANTLEAAKLKALKARKVSYGRHENGEVPCENLGEPTLVLSSCQAIITHYEE